MKHSPIDKLKYRVTRLAAELELILEWQERHDRDDPVGRLARRIRRDEIVRELSAMAWSETAWLSQGKAPNRD